MYQDKMNDEKNLTWSDSSDFNFFSRQLENPYDSTKKFFEFISSNLKFGSNSTFIDACAGSGAASIYALTKFNCKKIKAFDFQKKYLDIGLDFVKDKEYRSKINFVEEDIYKLSGEMKSERFDGVICLASLSWINNWRLALEELAGTQTSWLACSALIYEGLIDAKIDIKEYDENGMKTHQSPYNILSAPLIIKHLKNLGYSKFFLKKFDISIDLDRGDINHMGTYTENIMNGSRIQISGPIMLPWKFLLATRE